MAATPTLRLTQASAAPGRHRVQLALDGTGRPRTAAAQFAFQLSDQDRESLRWYLEDYLEYPIDPAPAIAARVEQRMAEVGRELFTAIFDSREGWSVWDKVHDQLHRTRIEVVSDVEAAAALPWELLRDPRTDNPLALDADTFVRVEHETARHPELGPPGGETIRVLLVICRPAGPRDVPFRSVASHLIRLSAQAREAFQLDVLRPPTFGQLAAVLRAAADRGRPYHVVHFDGHGTWTDVVKTGGRPAEPVSGSRYPLLSPARGGPHGYLLFEDPATPENQQLVDGPALGRLLVETGVPVLVLNACRSAHADLAAGPQTVAATADTHTRVRAYGSLAQEVVDQGVAGVVAMRYSVYVVAAAQFIADLYAALLQGLPLGTAVSRGRKQLADQPNREIAFAPRPLQDWVVPVVWEAVPLELFAKARTDERLVITLDQADAGQERAALEPGLPAGPDAGFYGRDETLLALDRAFDTHQVVLLHAFAGSGKTSSAVEFARWYSHTSGITGPVLFTSFEHYLPLARVLDQLGVAFEQPLAQAGVRWLALEESARQRVALQLLTQVPVLWIWDNVEPVGGFPEGTPSIWSEQEQAELVQFLDAIQGTKAKVLLTSRRKEHDWLGGLPAHVELPPMPMAERAQLARAIAKRYGRHLTDVEDWRPLLAYAQGNPLTVTVLVGQALRDGLRTRQQVEDFVARLRAGEARVEDDRRHGRSRSLGASLAYGFQTAFDHEERAQLAMLHLFQGTVDVDALRDMGDPGVAGEVAVPALAGLSYEAAVGTLDRAAEVGLLAPFGEGWYSIHPALPWYFAELFAEHHGRSGSAAAARLAYTRAVARLGSYYHDQYGAGQTRVTAALRLEEANLLHAVELARSNGWWDELIGAMQGLRCLFPHTGRLVEWDRLVAQATSELVDPVSDQPLPGREGQWTLITGYRVDLAEQARDWPTGIRLGHALVRHHRQAAEAALAADPASLDPLERNRLRNLAVSLEALGRLLMQQQRPDCRSAYTEAIELYRRIGDRPTEAVAAYNLGRALVAVPGMRDLDEAERWYRHARERFDAADRLRRGRVTGALGRVQLERFRDAAALDRPAAELLAHLDAGLAAYREALEVLPADAVSDIAVVHNQLGAIYQWAGQVDAAMGHFREALRNFEAAGQRFEAAQARFNVAGGLRATRQWDEALLWARAALDGFRAIGPGAADNAAETERLLAEIAQHRTGQGRADPR